MNTIGIVGSQILGLNEAILRAKVNTINVKPFLFGKHFPVQKVYGFGWKMAANQRGGINVAADVVADNSTIQRKARPIFESASGELPKIAISREMKRSEMKEYQTALAMAKDENAKELIRFWANDVEFCFNGVQSELEYIAWASLSNGGKLSFNTTNNAAVATEFDIDYQIDEENRQSTSVAFSDKNKADVVGAIANAVTQGKKIGTSVKYAFVNLKTFYQIATSDQIIKNCSTLAQNLMGLNQTPDLNSVNNMLRGQAWCNGVQLIVIDTDITRELANGDRITGNPFADDRIIFSESPILGTTQYDILQDNAQVVMRAERAHTVVKKYSTAEPLVEVTLAEADAIPVLDSAYSNIYVRTDGKDW